MRPAREKNYLELRELLNKQHGVLQRLLYSGHGVMSRRYRRAYRLLEKYRRKTTQTWSFAVRLGLLPGARIEVVE